MQQRKRSARSIDAIVALLVSSGGSSIACGQDVLTELLGPLADSSFGAATASGGDLDGDGVADLLVTGGSVDGSGTRGSEVFVYSGRSLTLLRSHFQAARTNDLFGGFLAIVGDLDGDGRSDYVIDEYDVGNHQRFGHVHSGATGAFLRSDALPTTNQAIVPQIVAMRDIDGDGVAEYGATDYGIDAAALGVISGATGTPLWTLSTKDYFTGSGALAEDVDGDGVQDFAAADFQNAGIAFFSGRDGSRLQNLAGNGAEGFGVVVGRVGDLDGDGLAELAVSAPYADGRSSGSGAIYVYSGADLGLVRKLLGDGTTGGDILAAWYTLDAGDVDGDNVDDVLSVTPWIGSAPGPGHLYSGRSGERLYRFEAAATRSWGPPPARLGDLDGDGLAEIALPDTEWTFSPPTAGRGRVRIVKGNDLYLLATPKAPARRSKLELETRDGQSTQLVVTAIVAVNGSPTFVVVGGLGMFDASGGWLVGGTVPAGLSGATFDFQSWAQAASGPPRDSAIERVTFP